MTDEASRMPGVAVRALAAGLIGALALAGCGHAPEATPLSNAEFVARADRICAEVASHFEELPEPEGGNKPVGLGGFIRDWVAQLRTLEPSAGVTEDWHAALNLLDRSADKLDDAEGGDENAQSEALFGLQARAAEHIEAMNMPFEVCFLE